MLTYGKNKIMAIFRWAFGHSGQVLSFGGWGGQVLGSVKFMLGTTVTQSIVPGSDQLPRF